MGIYGSYKTRTVETNDLYYNEVAFIMMNDIEVFAYTLGASFPGMFYLLYPYQSTSI